MQQPDEENIVFKTAAGFISNSNHPVFLTGKAGTGKTTFLRYIKDHSKKNIAVVAPTGVAAINAGGTTIHSFFQLPFGPYIPVNTNHFGSQNGAADKNSLLGNLRLSAERREVMEQLELLIIDEISMVRCDVVDAIDAVLRHVRRNYSKPFGGVQVLYIGDMYQLPPVIKDEEWKILSSSYPNQYFFSSHVVAAQAPIYIELKKVYRQSDSGFINLLNQVRNNEMDEDGYNLLHSRYLPEFHAAASDNFITLTTHNNKADEINEKELLKLVEKSHSFSASVNGAFYENSFPADEFFNVKLKAQVMFLKNDTEKIRRYYNGKIGVVTKIEDDKIWVECVQDDFTQLIEVKRETWRNIKYALNDKTQKIEEEELGSFTQFPLRLAWAITIHKSQGLTFQRAIIDAGKAFAPGQVYVALSRCTSLDGIVLLSKISYNSLHSDERIVDFAAKQQSNRMQEQILLNATKQYQQEIILQFFDFKDAGNIIRDLLSWVAANKSFGPVVVDWLGMIKERIDLFTRHGEKFSTLLNEFFMQDDLPSENHLFQERFKKAADWFFNELKTTCSLLSKSPAVTDNRQLAKDYTTKLQDLFNILSYRTYLFDGMKSGFDLDQYAEKKSGFKKEAFLANAYAGKSSYISQDIAHPDLYQDLKAKRDEISAEKGMPLFMVCKTQSLEDMAQYLPCTLEELEQISGFGKVKVNQFGKAFIQLIRNYCELHDLNSNMPLNMEKKVKKIKVTNTAKAAMPGTKKLTFDLYKQGKSVIEIAQERNLSLTTIETHLASFIETGELNVNDFMEKKTISLIRKMLGTTDTRSLHSLKEIIPSASYSEIKWVIASEKFTENKKSLESSSSEIVL